MVGPTPSYSVIGSEVPCDRARPISVNPGTFAGKSGHSSSRVSGCFGEKLCGTCGAWCCCNHFGTSGEGAGVERSQHRRTEPRRLQGTGARGLTSPMMSSVPFSVRSAWTGLLPPLPETTRACVVSSSHGALQNVRLTARMRRYWNLLRTASFIAH